jgi:hypothetical protein
MLDARPHKAPYGAEKAVVRFVREQAAGFELFAQGGDFGGEFHQAGFDAAAVFEGVCVFLVVFGRRDEGG